MEVAIDHVRHAAAPRLEVRSAGAGRVGGALGAVPLASLRTVDLRHDLLPHALRSVPLGAPGTRGREPLRLPQRNDLDPYQGAALGRGALVVRARLLARSDVPVGRERL